MRTWMMSVAAVGIVAAGSGCASVATNRYLQANNPVRIEALQAGGNVDGAILALDVFALDQVVAHPWLTTGAAVVDAAMIYGVYALGEDQEWWGSSDSSSGRQEGSGAVGRDGNTGSQIDANITGDGNTVIIQVVQPGGSNTGGNQPVTAPGSGSYSDYQTGRAEGAE